VGNSLTTGGPPRLVEESLAVRGGISRTNRRGTVIDLSQEAGLLDSNSNFFDPTDQGNSRLSLSLIQPLLSRGGQAYNERLLTQARIDSRVSWQQMRGDVEGHLADVINGYWRLYEIRCHFLQQVELLKQAHRIEEIIRVRRNFDAGALELAKVRQRVARRADGVLQLQAEVKRRQTQLARLVGAEDLIGSFGTLELIPRDSPTFPKIAFDLQDAVVQGLENRPDVRAAAHDLESSALSIQVTRAELLPQLTGVVDAYLLGLNGQNDVAQSFVDQFSRGGPGISASLRYELPAGRRAAKSRHREAFHRYRQRSEQLREVMQLTRAQIETAWISVNTSIAAQSTKQTLLETSLDEESILTRRWELMAGDGGSVGVVLENLLDSQQRRTDSERQWVTAQVDYMTSLVEIQRSMGTLLIRTGIQPHRHRGNKVRFQSTMIPDRTTIPDQGMLFAGEVPESVHDNAVNDSFRMEDDLIEELSTETLGGFNVPSAPASFPPVVVPPGFEMPTAKKNARNQNQESLR